MQNPTLTSNAARLFTLSWGRGRIGRSRPNSVRGLPRNPTRVNSILRGASALHPLQGERQIRPSPAEFGEGSSGQPNPRQPDPQRRIRSSPSPRGKTESAVPAEFGEGSSGHPASDYPRVSLENIQGGGSSPSPRERQNRPSAAEFGERSSGHRASDYPRVSLENIQGGRLFTLSKGKDRIGRPRPRPVRGLPGTQLRIARRCPAGKRLSYVKNSRSLNYNSIGARPVGAALPAFAARRCSRRSFRASSSR